MDSSLNSPIFCPRCNSIDVISAAIDWRCKTCGRNWRKHPKKNRKGWHQWNKGLTKETDERIAEYGRKGSKTKRANPSKYAEISRQNRRRTAKLEGKVSPEQMQELYDRLGTHREVAKQLGVRSSAISMFMKRHNLRSKPRFDVRTYLKNASPEEKNKMYDKVSKSMKGNVNWIKGLYKRGGFPNKDEQKLIDWFGESGIPLKFVGDGSVLIGGKNPDFINFRMMKILEYDCDFWHNIRPEGYDEKRNETYRRNGWDLLVLDSSDLQDKRTLVSKVKDWINRKV